MSRLSVVTWNAEGMFVSGTRTRRASPEDALTVLADIGADVVVVPEFGKYGQLLPEHERAIKNLGYELVDIPYE